MRSESKRLYVGEVAIGDGAPISIQTMTNTDSKDYESTLKQISELESVGAELIRISLPDEESVKVFKKLKTKTSTPLIADIHFRAEIAVLAIEAGADKIRINPGNIGGKDQVSKVAAAAAKRNIPIRIGVNAGSISDDLRDQDIPLSKQLTLSALECIDVMEKVGFNNIIVSAKAFGVQDTIETYRALSKSIDYPLHIGITESGTLESGSVRSSVGLGILLSEGIGDTLRVSLSADPVHEVHVAKQILQSLEIRKFHPELIACPTCSRCEVDLIPIARQVEKELKNISDPLKVAVMGCSVNGPGEARLADIGIAAGRGKGVLFKKGKPVKTVDEADFVDELFKLIERDE